MKNRRRNKAVSSVVGTALLLGMAIALFSIVQIIAVSLPYNPNPPSVRLVSNIQGDTIYIMHHGGESLPLDTKIIITFYNDVSNQINKPIKDNLTHSASGDPTHTLWDIGEKVEVNPGRGALSNIPVQIVVVDVESSSIIMQCTIQE